MLVTLYSCIAIRTCTLLDYLKDDYRLLYCMAEALILSPPDADARTQVLLREVEWAKFSYAAPSLNAPVLLRAVQQSPTLMQRVTAKVAKKAHSELQPTAASAGLLAPSSMPALFNVVPPAPAAAALVAQQHQLSAAPPTLPPKPKPKAGTAPTRNQSAGSLSGLELVSKSEPDSPHRLDDRPTVAIQRPLSLKQLLWGASNKTRVDDQTNSTEASQKLLDEALEMDDLGDNADGHSSESSLLDCRPLSAPRGGRIDCANGGDPHAALLDDSPSSGPPSHSSFPTSNAQSPADEHV